MAVNWRKVLGVVAVLVIVALAGFLLYWFLGRSTDDKPVTYKLVEFTEKGKTTSFNGDQLPLETGFNPCGEHFVFNKSATGDFIPPGGTFAWTVNFDYTMADGTSMVMPLCGGSIINSRYILTAAHCVYGTDKQKLRLTNGWDGYDTTKTNRTYVPNRLGFSYEGMQFNSHGIRSLNEEKIRLGQTTDYNSTTCDVTGDCAQASFVGIEEIIPHQNYNPKSDIYHSDIALIRVDQEIKFSKFIKPICLRNKTELGGAKYLAGWPQNLKEQKREPRKYVSVLSYPIEQKCNAHFMEKYKTGIESTQICATGDWENLFCIRDSGNAVAAIVNDRWFAEGIDSFGKKCGEKDSIGIYTEIAPFLDWIKSNLKK